MATNKIASLANQLFYNKFDTTQSMCAVISMIYMYFSRNQY